MYNYPFYGCTAVNNLTTLCNTVFPMCFQRVMLFLQKFKKEFEESNYLCRNFAGICVVHAYCEIVVCIM